jgi:stage II sporulation protein R
MKKIIVSICIIVSFCMIIFCGNNKTSAKVNDKLIRFHVIANSDSDTDQNTKLKVRDAILQDIGPKLSKSKSVEESLEIIQNNKARIESIANDVLKKYGKKYTAKAILGEFDFPVKNYGSITLPAGEYTALRVVLGEGDGKNWWCVMFPPLCFIDITKGLSTEETDRQLKKVMSNDEVSSITAFKQQPTKQEIVINPKSNALEKAVTASTKVSDTTSDSITSAATSKVEFRFKSALIFRSIMDKLEEIFN